MTRQPVITVRDLTVTLNGAVLLERLQFDVGGGEYLTIVGPNGAGKTTLLRALVRLIRPSAGTLTLEGRPLDRYDRRSLARVVSYVAQSDLGAVDFSVRAFVEMGRFPYLGPWQPLTAEDDRVVREAMATTEVAHLAERSLATLSGGERQRALVAAALAQGGRVLLLDEPTSYLDYRHQVQIVDLLDHLHKDLGYTLVVVTHDLNSTVGSSDNVLALKEGKIAFLGPPEAMLEPDRLAAIYDNDFELVARDGARLPFVVPSRETRTGNPS